MTQPYDPTRNVRNTKWARPKTAQEDELLAWTPLTDPRNAVTNPDLLVSRPSTAPLNTSTEQEDLHVPGAKDDGNKIRADLVLGAFPNALEAVCEVGTFGAAKYTDDGWLKVNDAKRRYTDALLRHYLEHAKGFDSDEDSGLDHLAHLAWNALAILELEIRKWQP